MKISRADVAALFGVGVTLTLFGASTSFVASPATPSIAGHLRAVGRSVAQPTVGDGFETTGTNSLLTVCSMGSLLLVAGAAAIKRGAITRHVNAPKKVKLEQIPRPENLLESPRFPIYQGGTDGYFSRSTRERHAMTWSAKDEFPFELPTGGMAVMNKGENLCYFRKKEQAICLSKALRKKKINDIKIYRIKKDGTVIFMHPLDGIWPENVTSGRPLVNWRPFPCGDNPQPATVKWTKYNQKAYEVDPLTTMFVKARIMAFDDQENLFPIPQVESWFEGDHDEYIATSKKMIEALGPINLPPKSL